MLFINSNPNRQIRTQQWSFIKYNCDALISFPDVTLLNLFRRIISSSYLLEGKKKQSSPGGFRPTCTAHWGHQLSQSLIESGNCYWTRTGRIFRSTSFKGWIPLHCWQGNCFELEFYDWGNMGIWMKIESENMS